VEAGGEERTMTPETQKSIDEFLKKVHRTMTFPVTLQMKDAGGSVTFARLENKNSDVVRHTGTDLGGGGFPILLTATDRRNRKLELRIENPGENNDR
jgi:hypothetical protein